MDKNNNKGFSLVELLIALAVGGIVLSALTMLIQNSVHTFTKQTVSAQLQSDADIALNQIENDVMEADMLIMYQSGSASSGYDYYLTEYSQVEYQGIMVIYGIRQRRYCTFPMTFILWENIHLIPPM